MEEDQPWDRDAKKFFAQASERAEPTPNDETGDTIPVQDLINLPMTAQRLMNLQVNTGMSDQDMVPRNEKQPTNEEEDIIKAVNIVNQSVEVAVAEPEEEQPRKRHRTRKSCAWLGCPHVRS